MQGHWQNQGETKMKKSIIAIVAAMGVAFAATSAVADDGGQEIFEKRFPASQGETQIHPFKNANLCDRTWQKCAFAVEEGGFNNPSKKAGVPNVDTTPQWKKNAFEPKGE